MTRSPTLPSNGGLMNPDFKYVKEEKQDLRESFKRIREAQAGSLPANVASIKQAKGK